MNDGGWKGLFSVTCILTCKYFITRLCVYSNTAFPGRAQQQHVHASYHHDCNPRASLCVCLFVGVQANVDRTADPSEWRLDALAAKMVQYCPLLEGLTGKEGVGICDLCVVCVAVEELQPSVNGRDLLVTVLLPGCNRAVTSKCLPFTDGWHISIFCV